MKIRHWNDNFTMLFLIVIPGKATLWVLSEKSKKMLLDPAPFLIFLNILCRIKMGFYQMPSSSFYYLLFFLKRSLNSKLRSSNFASTVQVIKVKVLRDLQCLQRSATKQGNFNKLTGIFIQTDLQWFIFLLFSILWMALKLPFERRTNLFFAYRKEIIKKCFQINRPFPLYCHFWDSCVYAPLPSEPQQMHK